MDEAAGQAAGLAVADSVNMNEAAGQAAGLAVADCVNSERRVDGGRSAGQSVGPTVADEAAQVGGRRSSRQAERRQTAGRRGRSAERSGLPGRMATRSAGTDRRRTARWASLNAAPQRSAVAPGAAPSAGGGGRGGSQQARRRQVTERRGRSAERGRRPGRAAARSEGTGQRMATRSTSRATSGSAQMAGAPGEAPAVAAETGAALLGRRVRVAWPAEGTSFDGTVHSWSPVDGRHEVRYDDGDVQWHVLSAEQVEWLGQEREQQPQEGVPPDSPPCVEGPVEGAEDAGVGEDGGSVGGLPPVVAVDVAAVGTPQSNSRPDPADGLESPPVPEELVGLLGTPDGPLGGRVDPLGVDGVTSPGSAGPGAPQLGTPRPSPGMEQQRFVGPLFRPVEGEWYGHVMRSMPPTGIIRDGVTTTFSWFFCPRILDAVGWESAFPNLPRDAGWNGMVGRLARVLQEAGITWEVVAGYVLEEGMHPFHFSRQRQEQLIRMDQQLGQEVQMFAAGLVASARLLEDGRDLVGHRVRWGDTGTVDEIDLTNSRTPVEFLSHHGQPSSPDRTRAASQPLPERRAVAEACDGPVVEDEPSSGGAGTPGGEHALLDACALEALLRGEASGADTFTHHGSVLSRNLAADELDGVGRFVHPPESVVFLNGRGGLPFIGTDGWADAASGLYRGAVVSPSLRAAWRRMQEADAQRFGPLPEQDTLVVEGDDGEFRWVSSAEGAQQGDPLGPFFMAVALQPALQATLNEHPDVFIMAYLDDIHILGPPDKVRAAYDTIVPLLIAAGLELNVPKSTVFCPDGACPEFEDVVDEAGTPMPGAVVPLPGVKVLGIPVGSDQWVADKCVEMALAAGAILPKLARLDDPQVQLLLLRFCAHPRFMHLVRGVPPHLLAHGALAHDNGIQECLQEVAGSPYPLGEEAVALSQLPTRWGGLGLSSAQRLAPAGWLGSWAQVWGKMVVLFPAVRDMLPHLGAPEDTEVGGHPLAAGLTAAMEDVRGARARVVAALGVGHSVPESLRVPEAAPVWGGFGSSQPTRQKELTNYQHGAVRSK
ncbi:hypothetical protein CYMTET_17253 [Cymbomonas tetramitiformis]|uniref:Reverse transcriptase domain-containing protein n=1 Tax=Cymbomonas tetramitiformis TaxID=36881 RepID=A0AAE0GBW1_9CHLO|nr:hypothetical protein CYMTET_17253 [Cymbomonas tetramitiformis]